MRLGYIDAAGIEALLNKYMPRWRERIREYAQAPVLVEKLLCPFKDYLFLHGLEEALKSRVPVGRDLVLSIETKTGQ